MAEIGILLGTTITLALFHTLIGVDHYIPFIAVSKANNWTIRKSICVVLICGFGHMLGSVILGIIGIVMFMQVTSFEGIQDIREIIAIYILIGFGIIYTIYGIICVIKNKPHTHAGLDGQTIAHSHEPQQKKKINAFWGLFIFFLLGACKPMIPLMMQTAAKYNIFTLIVITASFAVITIGTMLLMTLLGIKGFQLIKTDKLERYTHAIAGGTVLLCGILVLFLPI